MRLGSGSGLKPSHRWLARYWEIFEFSIDRTGLFQTQRGLADTMLDLIADTVGALMAAATFAGMSHHRARIAS